MGLIKTYRDSFTGLSSEVWWLALVTLINRAGAMVIPFLSIYMEDELEFSKPNIGWVMTAYGAGSLVGSWAGGKLTDRFGNYPVMIWSLMLSAIGFVGLQFAGSFMEFLIGIFLLISVADAFRPAVFVSITAHSRPKNRARSIGLIRLAINLGWSVGPALGGFIIAWLDYSMIFWIDGVTCVIAALVLVRLLKPKDPAKEKEERKKAQQAQNGKPTSDLPFIAFLIAMMLIAISFLQLFSSVPLYFHDGCGLEEWEIGLLMALNGVALFLLEMPIIKKFENPKYSVYNILIFSTWIMALSFFVLTISPHLGILIAFLALITLGEVFNFPFGNSWAMTRSEGKRQGAYMGLYTISFAISNLVCHNLGMQLIENFGYNFTWYVMTGILVLAVAFLMWMKRLVHAEGPTKTSTEVEEEAQMASG